MAENDSYQIILDPVPEDKQPAMALFLSGCFSLPPSSTRRIVASGPIAILSGLDGVQSETVLAELKSSLPEGVGLRVVREGADTEASRLEWPRPPKIFGRSLDEFTFETAASESPCPSCGKMLRITRCPDGDMAVSLVRHSGRTVMIPNPDSTDSDKDPLFSGFKPLAADATRFASFRSLQAGDTGFWGDTRSNVEAAQYEAPPEPENRRNESHHTGKSGGLAAYMKPGVFAVILSRTKDAPVVKNVAEIMGISEEEARQKCLSMGLCVARDISLDEAQTLLARFKALGGRARIVKPM